MILKSPIAVKVIEVAAKVTEAAEAVVVAETAVPTTHLDGFTP